MSQKADNGNKNVYAEVIQQIKKDTDKIRLESENKAGSLRKSMEEEIEEKIQNILKKAKKIAELRKNRIISTSEIEIRRINLSKKHEIIEAFIKQALNELKNYAQTKSKYKEYLLKFIKQGIESVYSFKSNQIESKMDEIFKFFCQMKINPENIDRDKVDIVIYINERDQKYLTTKELNKYVDRYHVKISIKIKNTILGGVIISTSDQSVLFNNTFTERLTRNKFDIIRRTSDIFWG